MNYNSVRNWKVMTWNIIGLNSSWKWDPVKNKIADAQCDIICLQETKKKCLIYPFLEKSALNTLMPLISFLLLGLRV
jgi:endonuclease/exonuclease/phosphatase family metal-dependent hydrolase